jgi:hypothetical protein
MTLWYECSELHDPARTPQASENAHQARQVAQDDGRQTGGYADGRRQTAPLDRLDYLEDQLEHARLTCGVLALALIVAAGFIWAGWAR